ncbi:nestin isoform X2 [Parambassis ranga]|uniref:Nestin isoform X2 n=1 Tax=Parambassis ranga TaxID=210632 RepID=A0A6P7K0A4_9TELE|nr:nestin-like isoform X2 [Parambassis ranga]
MELHSMPRISPHNLMGEEKHQMLDLNRRLESYLNRVKLLEEENMLLVKEIKAMRHNSQGALTHRKGLEEELRQARLEVEAAWRDRVLTEMEVSKLTEELHALDLQRQKEAQAHMKAKTKMAHNRKELEEEQRAQIWLREKVSQLEHEMNHLIQNHQEDVAHLEATLTHSRTIVPHTSAQRCNQTPNLLQLGHEYSQRATRAWQEAAESYQGQLVHLEESLEQARSRLTQVGQEKRESLLKLQALEKEIASAQDVRLHLEKAVAQQRDTHSHEIKLLQEHLEGLEAERDKVDQQIEHLVLENRGLLQMKMSLGLEVATYRALLDGESLKGDVSLLKQPRNISITDVAFSPQRVKMNDLLSARHKSAPLLSVCTPPLKTATPVWSRRPENVHVTPKILEKPACVVASKSWQTPYPKILQDGAVESFRPQEVQEKVTCAEPLSPPNEQEAEATSEGKKGTWNNINGEIVESVVSYQLESCLGSEPEVSHTVEEMKGEEEAENTETEDRSSCEPDMRVNHEPLASDQMIFSDPSSVVPEEDTVGQHEDQEDTEKRDEEDDHTVSTVTNADVTEDGFGDFVSRPDGIFLEGQESCLSSEPEVSHHQVPEEACGISDESDAASEQEDVQYTHSSIETWITKDHTEEEVEQEASSDSETEAMLEPTFESRPSSPESEPVESVFNQETDYNLDEDISNKGGAETRQEVSCSMLGASAEDKLYPDGEEMDTWDSVIEKKVDLNDEGVKKDEEKGQHAEPEEDISPKEPETKQEVHHDDNVDSSQIVVQGKHEEEWQEGDDEDDSQNVSVSWRTELESDSYAQDNTVADTRPLIRYKSDETDANTQASHMDESESSEGEQDKKNKEMETGASKRFGTMEDLCEDAEGVTMDEEYNMGYTHFEDRDDGQGAAGSERSTLVDDEEVSEEHSEEETEEHTRPVIPTNVDYNEELDTDRLVEQELENLSTDSYSTHFSLQQVNERIMHLQSHSVEEMNEEEEAENTETEDRASCEPDMRVNHERLDSDQMIFSNPSSVVDEADTAGQHEDQEDTEKREEEDDHNVSTVTHPDVTEDGFGDFVTRSDGILPEVQEDLQDLANSDERKEAAPVETNTESQQYPVSDFSDFPEAPEAVDWEVPEKPKEGFEIRDGNEKCDDEDVMTHQEEPPEISPDSMHDENDIFAVKEEAGDSIHGYFPSAVKIDSWVSSLESGAAHQPDGGS